MNTKDNTEHPYALWVFTGAFNYLMTFPDEDLAAQAAVRFGGRVIPNPTVW